MAQIFTLFAPTVLLKTLHLDLNKTWQFMQLSILDAIHDSGSNATEPIVRALTGLYVHWLECNNPSLRPYASGIYERLVSDLAIYHGDEKAIAERFMSQPQNKVMITTVLNPAGWQYVLDNRFLPMPPAPGTVAAVVWSTFYDKSSFNITCGGTEPKYAQALNAPEVIPDTPTTPGTAPISAANDFMAPIKKYAPTYTLRVPALCTTVSKCESEPYDSSIKGVFRATQPGSPPIYYQITLAYRALMVVPAPPGVIWKCACTFAHRTCDGVAIQRGFAPLAKAIGEIIRAWVAFCAQRNALEVARSVSLAALRAQVEISAKLWGDLGMVVDASCGSQMCVSSDDKMMRVFCLQLNANCFSNRGHEHPIIGSDKMRCSVERISGSAFAPSS